MGEAYKRYLYKGSYERAASLLGEIEWLGFSITNPTTTVDRYTFFQEATTSAGTVLRIIDIEYTDATKATISGGKRVS